MLVLFALGENKSAVGFHLDLLVDPSSVENFDHIVGHAFHQLVGVDDEAKKHKSVVVSCCILLPDVAQRNGTPCATSMAGVGYLPKPRELASRRCWSGCCTPLLL